MAASMQWADVFQPMEWEIQDPPPLPKQIRSPLLPPLFSADKTTVQHPSDYLLERYSMGRITETEIALLKEHLLICEKCRNTLVQMNLNHAAIREALKQWRDEAED